MTAKEQLGDMPAMPVSPDMDSEIHNGKWGSLGMTKREEIAKHMMAAIVNADAETLIPADVLAAAAVAYADALLAALAKEPQP